MPKIGVLEPIPGVVYQSSERLQKYVDAGILTTDTLVSTFAKTAKLHAGRTALSEGSWSCTYAELDAITDKAASAFIRLGLKPLDRALFQLPNSKELVIAFIGCLKAGIIPICALAAHRQVEIGYLGKHASARAHFIAASDTRFDFIAFAKQIRQQVPSLQFTIDVAGTGAAADEHVYSLERLMAAEGEAEARNRVDGIEHDPFQVVIFQLSGGTTDVPKIIPRFHNEYLYTIRTTIEFHGLDETLVSYTSNPMMHNAPMACLWGPAIFFGGEVAVANSLDPSVVGPLLLERKPNWLIIPPVVLFRLRDAGWLDRLDFTNVLGFSIPSGVEQFSPMVKGALTFPMFGMTEGLLATCCASDSMEARTTTVGRPQSPFDEMKILRPDTEEELPDGELGELAIRGPCTIAGYYDSEDRNSVAFTSDGFYRSGDLMKIKVIDGRRYLVFEGRIKDVVSRGGEKINCMEIERIASLHPSINSIAIVAMPDPIYGERACAFVIPAPGKTITVPELGTFLERQGLAKFKWPERIEIVSEFPNTSSGKLSKPKLRERIVSILQREQAASQ